MPQRASLLIDARLGLGIPANSIVVDAPVPFGRSGPTFKFGSMKFLSLFAMRANTFFRDPRAQIWFESANRRARHSSQRARDL